MAVVVPDDTQKYMNDDPFVDGKYLYNSVLYLCSGTVFLPWIPSRMNATPEYR